MRYPWKRAAKPAQDGHLERPAAMTAREVDALVSRALAESRWRSLPRRKGHTSGLLRALERFEALRIFPVPASISLGLELERLLGVHARRLNAWFITWGQMYRVFYDEKSGSFGMAWAPDGDDEHKLYTDTGLRTDDPVEALIA